MTRLLEDWGNGDRQAFEELTPLVYHEFYRPTMLYLRQDRQDHTPLSAALLNEAHAKHTSQHRVQWPNRAHFIVIVGQTDTATPGRHSPRKNAAKCGSNTPRPSLDQSSMLPGDSGECELDVLAPDERNELDANCPFREIQKSAGNGS